MNKPFPAILAAVLLAPMLPAAPAWAAAEPDASRGFSAVAREIIPAVVYIQVEKSISVGHPRSGGDINDPYGYFGDEFLRRFFGLPRGGGLPRQFRQEGQGSGFIISKDGYILTNNHVVGNVDQITVRLHDGREFKARLIGTDPHSEVAVIKIDADDLPVLPLGDSEDLEIGDWVLAVGNPFGLSETLTVGVVSAKGRSNMQIADYENFIQTDAAINPGNSGGPLVNLKGQAVGINTAIFSRSGGYMGIGFAIPINMAAQIKDQLVRTGKVQRGYIGIRIQDLTRDLARSFGLAEETQGILIAGVEKGSAGEKAGLAQGDIIQQLDGRAAASSSEFRNRVAETMPGSTIHLDVLRNGKSRSISLSLGALGGSDSADAGPTRGDEAAPALGLEVEPLTPELAQRFGYTEENGVVIARVIEGSPAERAGLQPGHLITRVNQVPVASPKDFQKALKESGNRDVVSLLVTDGNFARFVALNVK
jgi:serine protease Do